MTNEEMQRAMEFIIQQQAQYAAKLERDEPRLAKVEESFSMLVELARRRNVRPNTIGHRYDNDEGRVASLKSPLCCSPNSPDGGEYARTRGQMATLSQTMNE